MTYRMIFKVLLPILLIMLAGCAAADGFFGIDAAGNDTGGTAPSDTLGAVGGAFSPWVPTALGGIGWLYATIRGRRYKSAAHSLVNGVAWVRENQDKLKSMTPEAVQELLSVLNDQQIEDGTYKAIKAMREN